MVIEKEKELLEILNDFEDWTDKYEFILDLGNEIPLIDEKDKIEENLVKGCQSNLWLTSELIDKKVNFFADADSPFPKGMASMLISIYNNKTPEIIMNFKTNFLKESKLIYNLSPLRRRGVESLIKKFYFHAEKYIKIG